MPNKTKVCTKCNNAVNCTEYHRRSKSPDGLSTVCKACAKSNKLLVKRSEKGLVASIYSDQKSHSRVRGNPQPTYSSTDLLHWVYLQDNFKALYAAWVASSYDKWCRPSVDRLRDSEGYSLDNIRLVSWKENNIQSHKDKLSGENKIDSKVVYQYTLSGEYVTSYHSMSEASRVIGIGNSALSVSISKCTSAGGFQWRYTKYAELAPFNLSKNVIQLTKEGKFLRKWESAAIACEGIGVANSGGISKVCRGVAKTAYGYKWEYVKE